MVVPPDDKNPPTASAASEPHGDDLTLNGPTLAADAAPDLRISPEVDSSSTFIPEPGVDILWPAEPTRDADRSWVSRLLHIRPGAHDATVTMQADTVRPADQASDADRSWLSRLRSSKASSEKEQLRSAHDAPVTIEEIRSLEKHLASLATLRDICASIDQRLARVEDVSGQPDVATIDQALHDLCSQMYERLLRVEAAIQRTEGFVADPTLQERYINIERQLVQARMALQRTEESLADKTLHEVCRNIDARLERTEDTLQRREGIVAESLEQLSARMIERFADVEETLRLTQKSLADSLPPEMGVNIERQLIQARMALQRTEDTLHRGEGIVAESLEQLSARMTARFGEVEETLRAQTALQRTEETVADKTLHELCRNIEARLERTEGTLHRGEGIVAESLEQLSARMITRFGEVEETLRAQTALQRTEETVADKTLHELCQNIEARLERTEETLHRSEGFVAEWLQDFSARTTARFSKVEDTIQRIERMVSSKTFEQQPSVRMDDRLVQAEEPARPLDRGVLASAGLLLNRFVKIKQANRPIQLPWMAGLAVPVLVVVAVLAIGALIKTNRVVAPEQVVPLTTTDQIATPVVTATNQEIRPAIATAVMANAPRSTRESRSPALPQRSSGRESTPTSTRSPRFVGTLSITSVPSGASVSINGKPAGVTPLKLSGQRAGSLAVQIAHDGFERWSASVHVPADQLTRVNAKLRTTPR